MCRRRVQGGYLAAAEGFEEGLETAGDQAAHDLALDHDLADPGGPLDLSGGWRAETRDFDSLCRVLCAHASNLGSGGRAGFGGATEPVLNRRLSSTLPRSTVGPWRRRTSTSGNLPAETTSFIGRRHELAETRRKLSAARLVTLVGPGGVGKTRLAIRAASDLARGVPDGAWLVQLAELRDAALIGNAVLAALDLRDQGAAEPVALLRSYLRDKATAAGPRQLRAPPAGGRPAGQRPPAGRRRASA